MASLPLRIQLQAIGPWNLSFHSQTTESPFSNLSFLRQKKEDNHLSLSFFFPSRSSRKSGSCITAFAHCSLSSPNPPSTRQEAIFQAKTCLLTALQRPLNSPILRVRLKKLKQPRFRVEIPVIDDSPDSLTQLAFDVFGEMPIKRKGSAVNFLILWPSPNLAKAAARIFQSRSLNTVKHMDIVSASNGDIRNVNSELVVFLAPEASQLENLKAVADNLYPKPVVTFNPNWGFEEESSFGEMIKSFLDSFEVVYSFMGLEVRGVFSKKKGVVFRCAMDWLLSGERWVVLVEEEGELKVVSKFEGRPSISEVENVLYDLMAMNSPITKSAKFFKELVTNVTGKR